MENGKSKIENGNWKIETGNSTLKGRKWEAEADAE
jgi:hypothetical protein